MDDLEQQVFDAGVSEAPPPDLSPPSSPAQPSVSPPTSDSRAVSDAIDALRGPVPQYGTQPRPPAPPQPPPNPEDEPVTGGVLRQLLDERAQRQRLEQKIQELSRQEQERAKQQQRPRAEEQIFSDPEAYDRSIEQRIDEKVAHMRLESDMQLNAMRFGPMFGHAFEQFKQACDGGRDPVSYFRVMNSRSPGEEMVRWFNERRILEATRGDLDGFVRHVVGRAQSDPEFFAAVMGQGQPAQDMPVAPPQQSDEPPRGPDGRFSKQAAQPRHEVRLPSSLQRMNGTSRGVAFDGPEDGSEEAIFDAGRSRPQ